MDTKRLMLAIVLSVFIFMVYQFIAFQMGWLEPPSEPAPQTAEQTPAGPDVPAATVLGDPGQSAATSDPSEVEPPAGDPSAKTDLPAFAPTEGKTVTVDTPLYKAVFHSAGGILRRFELKQYHTSQMEHAPLVTIVDEFAAGQAPMGLLLDGIPTWVGNAWTLEGGDLSLDEQDSGTLTFSTEANGIRVIRELSFSGSAYTVTERLRLSAPSHRNVNVAFTFGTRSLDSNKTPGLLSQLRYTFFGGEKPVLTESPHNLTRVAWFQNGSFSEESAGSNLAAGKLVQGHVSWMAVMNNYFMGAVSMADDNASAKGQQIGDAFHVLIGRTNMGLLSDGETSLDCAYFLGPKESKRLADTPNNLDKALDYGFFSIVAKPLVWLLDFFYGFVHNYGVAIILMTILIKILFWPLSQKSYKSMQQMKQLQPLMQKLREKYAGDKEAMNREIMQLYKTYKVNPAGGCLPILVQIPVFFGLYQALLNAIELRHAPFISTLPFTDIRWLTDLASADPLFITPLVMGASMFLQQKMTPMPGDPTQAKVMMFMPVVFTALFLSFPSGLVVYWLANNVISIGQQWLQLRRTP